MFEQTLFDAMLNPSILHWLAVMFGEWVYSLTDSTSVIDHPVSPLMVVLASISICAIIGFVIMVTMLGGRAILSTGATGSIVSQTSPYWHFRVIAGLFLIMPTSYGISELNEYNVSVSHGQVAVIQGGLWGGGVADVMYQVGAESLLKYNISGSPGIDNTVQKSNELAKAFVCNEFYYRNVGASLGQSLIHYVIVSMDANIATSSMVGVESISDISIADVTTLPAQAQIHVLLGGPKAYCGDFSVSLDAIRTEDSKSFIAMLSRSLYAGLQHVRDVSANNSQIQFVKSLDVYELFASRYYEMFSGTNANAIAETAIAETGDNSIDVNKVVNAGGLQNVGMETIEDKIASTTDALNYLAIYLSYRQRDIAKESSKVIYSEFTGVNDDSGSLDGFSEKLFKDHMSDYISAGMFWSVFHNLSDVMYEGGRALNAFSLANTDIEQARLCQNSNILQQGWNAVSSVFGDDRYLCQSSQHVIEGFNVLVSHATTKAKTIVPESITLGSGSTAVDQDVWRSFFAVSSQGNAVDNAEIDFMMRMLIGLIEKVWSMSLWFGDDNAVVGGGISMERSLLSGNDAIMLDLNGTTSPFSLLTQLGQETRDLAFLAKSIHVFIKSFVEAVRLTNTAATHAMIDSPLGLAAGFTSFFITLGVTLFSNAVAEILGVVTTLYGVLITSSLAITYGIPLIPVTGWVFVIIGVLFAIGAAAAAINFAAILMILPKGDGVFAPDTERIVSLVFGIFIRQGLIVVGFIFHLTLAFVGLSILNLIWVGFFINKFDNLSLIDGIFWVFVFFVGYVVMAFFICLYAFKVIGQLVDTVGVWISTYLVGGAFGSNADDIQSATHGFRDLSSKLDDLAKSVTRPPSPSSGGKQQNKSDAPKQNPFNEVNA
ncbi:MULTISPECIES: hypothetical protein [Vibrio]|uniref:hypothetical protein n=1 Tax=Vibrio TaxID=662 RepID=UPI0020760F92|nr:MULTISPECIES: hypothetical protein [Vibrio]USD35487.1 hypothetical protein J8Z27_22980 [Vibrio sp. SCSIO 43186]USD72611.1 hypothetical protein J4N41_22985 [Vibrio sp. SCSIO 43139]USD99002.1 hypothetical protein CTT30_23295 [Vibrio coralliilyticus]